MNRHLSGLFLIILAFMGLVACGGSVNKQPEVLERSVKVKERADKAYARKSYDRALKLYAEALRLSRSVEDIDGTVNGIIYVGMAYRALGQLESAHASLDELMRTDGQDFSMQVRSYGNILKTLLYIDSGELGLARDTLDRAERQCDESKWCEHESGLLNVNARLTLLEGDHDSALLQAKAGAKAAKREDNSLEESNAHRFMGDALLAGGSPVQALKAYETALEMDKTAAIPWKIAHDLRGLGEASLQAGRMDEARGYLVRALDVSVSGRLEGLADEIRARLRELDGVEQ